MHWLLITIGLLVLAPVAGAAAGGVEKWVSARYLAGYYDLVLDTGVRPTGLSHLDNSESARRMSEATGATRDWLFQLGISGSWGLLATRLSGAGAFIVVARWRWWVPLVLVGAWLLLSRAISNWRSAVFDEMLDITGTDRRRARYLRDLLGARSVAKEMRLFGLMEWLRDSYVETWRRTMSAIGHHRSEQVRKTLPPLLVVLLVTAGGFALLARDAWIGKVDVGSLVTVVQAMLVLSAFGPAGDNQTSATRTTTTLSQAAALRRDLGLPFLPPACECEPAEILVPQRRAAAIEIKDATFTYPGGSKHVLEHLDLVVPAGQSLAIVGANGAGKSTVIKLLCGLYQPDSGTVRVDGIDPAVHTSCGGKVSAIFQEFIRFPLSIRDNVEAGAGWQTLGENELGEVAAVSGVAPLVAGLDQGWNTVLSPQFKGGTDLSGGQWQRVALARALAGVRAGAGVLILDEPSANLDVRAEVALFEQLLEAAADVTTILVSHRLSSVRNADRIVVLGKRDSGAAEAHGVRVIEDGTHAELLALQGEYAHMFELQASRFAVATTAEENL